MYLILLSILYLIILNMEKEMATHFSILAWMEKPGRLQSIGSLRVGHDWETSLSLFTFMHWRRKWQPTPVFLPRENPRDRGAWWATVYGVAQSQTRLKWLSSSSIVNILYRCWFLILEHCTRLCKMLTWRQPGEGYKENFVPFYNFSISLKFKT